MSLKSDLIKARSFVERGWHKGCNALDSNRRSVYPNSPEAVSWCVIGACLATTKRGISPESYERFDELMIALDNVLRKENSPYKFLQSFNDNPEVTKEKVLTLFDRTIVATS